MKRLIFGILVAVFTGAAGAVLAQSTDRAAVDKQLIANERAVLDAFAKGDAAGFRSHLAPEAFGIDPGAGVVKSADWEQMMKSAKVESWDIDSARVYWVSAGTAILTYRWTGKGTFGGQPAPSPMWSSTVWVNRSGKWLALFHQETVAVEATPETKKK